jgi:2-oxoglutarate ferredoxin oxidoreductase subunit alpha
VAHAHLRHLHPFPRNLGDILASYDQILVPELNMGQLRLLIQARFLRPVAGLNKVKGKPFTVAEIMSTIKELLG